MAEIPTPFVWADNLFTADPISQGAFEAGVEGCDWTPERLNGALYMLSNWTAMIADCIQIAAPSELISGENPEGLVTNENFIFALCAGLFAKGGQSFEASGCDPVVPAAGDIGEIFVDLNGAGDDVNSIRVWDGNRWAYITNIGAGTCVSCPNGDVWCFDGAGWAIDTGGGTTATAVTPGSAGQNPADWGRTLTLPPNGSLPTGPSGVPGYWHVTALGFDGDFTVHGTTYPMSSGGTRVHYSADAGTAFSFNATNPGGDLQELGLHWVAV